MAMSKPHYAALAASILVFVALYFGFPKTPSGLKIQEQSRALRGEQISSEQLVESAKARLTSEERAALVVLEQSIGAAKSDSERIDRLKELSGWWYARGYRGVAGIVAEQVAEEINDASAWSIAGATYYQALQGETEMRLRKHYAERSIRAFESAVSLAPQTPEHRVNLALVYAENPPADNPMKAVQMLRELEQQYPQSAAVYNALGRLALKTGQWQRAIERLEKALELDPKNPNTPCLLLKAYENDGQTDKAAALSDRCQ